MDESTNARFKEITAALSKLRQAREQFWAQTDASTYSMAELLERFLQFTDGIVPEERENIRLTTFAEDCYEHLGWSGTCQAYEYMLAEYLCEASWLYHSWTFFGKAVMKDAEKHSFEERVRVAADVEFAYVRAAEDLGYYWPGTMGYFYYYHPLKDEQPQVYLLKSKKWFERAMETEDFCESDHHDVQVYGHVHFELDDFRTALHWYEKLAALEDRCGDACFLDRTLAERRLVECQERLAD